jgi:hypothetical protein
VFDAVRALHDEGGDPIKIAEAYLAIRRSGKYASVGKEAIEEIISISGQKPLHVLKFLQTVGEMQQRRMNFLYGRVRQKNLGWCSLTGSFVRRPSAIRMWLGSRR